VITQSQLKRLFFSTILLFGAVGSANASHLFSQGGGSPVPLTAGNSMQFMIDGYHQNFASASAGQLARFDFYLDNGSWGAGDHMRITSPSGFTVDFVSGALPAGATENTASVSLTGFGATPINSPSAFDTLISDNLVGTTWRVDALLGAFDIAGFVITSYDGSEQRQTVGRFATASGSFTTPTDIAQVPETGTLTILGLGLTALYGIRRRKHHLNPSNRTHHI
jgi:hypothetical protein